MQLRTVLLTICAFVFLAAAGPVAAQWKEPSAFEVSAEIADTTDEEPPRALRVARTRYTGTLVGTLLGGALAVGLFAVVGERGGSVWDTPQRYYLFGLPAGGALIGLAFDLDRSDRHAKTARAYSP